MAKMVLLASYLSVNSSDISAYTNKIELTIEVEDRDVTTFGSNGWTERLGGLKSGTLAVGIKQDVAASAVDSILWPLLGTVVTFEVRSSNAVVGTSNPKWTGSVLISELSPVNGSVGDDASMDVTWPTSGAVTRATA